MYSAIPSSSVNLTDSNSSTTGFCDDLQLFTPAYIITPISVIGILLNVSNILVFLKTKTTTIKGDMTKYLICKSIFDICLNLSNVFPLVRFASLQYDFIYSYCYQVFNLVIMVYLHPVSILCSIAFDFAATFDRYRLVTNKCKFFDKIFVFRRGMSLIICISIVGYIYKFFFFHIVPIFISNNYTNTYSTEGNMPREAKIIIDLIQKISIHFLLVTIILILNVLMLVKLKNIFKAKRTVITPNSRTIQDRVNSSESRNTYMLIWTSPVTIIPNYMFFVINILQFFNYIEFYNPCVDAIGDIVFSLQFSCSFIFYYWFNVNFKTVVHEIIRIKRKTNN